MSKVQPTGEGGATRAPICIELKRDGNLSSKSIVMQNCRLIENPNLCLQLQSLQDISLGIAIGSSTQISMFVVRWNIQLLQGSNSCVLLFDSCCKFFVHIDPLSIRPKKLEWDWTIVLPDLLLSTGLTRTDSIT
uniref:Uncharacterized protein n=1 Tax=Lactuca sativa TaxID=4236 RepID=A0A9R1URK3_LACSA|nr:hypothetical protein LSAT_V11C800422350 [Lactuca sativa]